MDIAGMWRGMRAGPADVPRPGAHQAPADGITLSSVTQQCQVALPVPGITPDEVTVTVTSQRPGVAAQVTIGANLNSQDGSYQGPRRRSGRASSPPPARRSKPALSSCPPPGGLSSVSVPRPPGQTGHPKALI
ncbi:MAG TPA: hypothetical protein VGS19_01850 [Streptosporangiaceae bacterium]|nr:hypothetical protein [Streptosporangiaceae bacterium]